MRNISNIKIGKYGMVFRILRKKFLPIGKSVSDGIPEGITQLQNKKKGEAGIRTTGRKRDVLVNLLCIPVRFLS